MTITVDRLTEEMRDSIKYQPLVKPRSKAFVFVHSLFSSTFIRKYAILSVILCLGLGYLFYQRVLYQQYIYNTLPLYQRSLKFRRPPLPEPDELIRDRWYPIGDPAERYQIYSAYFDPRLEIVESLQVPKGIIPFGSVRIFAVLPLYIRRKGVFCNFRYEEDKILRHRADKVEPIHEHFDMPFAASYVICKLVGNEQQLEVQLPAEVGISYDLEPSMQGPTSFVPIHYPSNDLLLRAGPSRDLAVCVGPMHHNYSNAARIVEFVEYWKLLGAEQFYFYNTSVTSAVNAVMTFYREKGTVEVLEWNFKGYKFEEEVRYGGIFAALNDCLYRSTMVGDFRYSAIVDFDEFLLPTGEVDTYLSTNLVDFLHKRNRFDVHSFNFQAVFFYGFYQEDFSRKPPWTGNRYLYTQVRNIRTEIPLFHHNRSKYVAIGRNVFEAGNHFVWQAARETIELRIPEQEGLLFHYRDECVGYGCDKVIRDNTARRYEAEIWLAVDDVCRRLFSDNGGRCPLGDLDDIEATTDDNYNAQYTQFIQ